MRIHDDVAGGAVRLPEDLDRSSTVHMRYPVPG